VKRQWPARLWRAIRVAAKAFSSPAPELILCADGQRRANPPSPEQTDR
jgi:hypothetical protein